MVDFVGEGRLLFAHLRRSFFLDSIPYTITLLMLWERGCLDVFFLNSKEY
jgi:hypothetical protein